MSRKSLRSPSLTEIFRDLGLQVNRFSGEANFRQLLEDPPDLIFIDVDFSPQEPLKFITLLRTLLPKALIAVYTSMRSWSGPRRAISRGPTPC